jgi:hypothetical protein
MVIIYRPLQDQMNDFMLFGMSILFVGFIAGITKSLVADVTEPESNCLKSQEQGSGS